jgi:Tfp pilus assembly protein PilX
MKLRGSALVFSLVVLSFLLISALSVATVSVTNKRSVLTSKNSTLSFQIADSAAEEILQQIYKVNDAFGGTVSVTLDDLAGHLGGGPSCTSNTIKKGSVYAATFYKCTDADNCTPIACDNPTWRTDVSKMKILGTFGGVTRAIEVGIAPDATP